MTNKKVYEPNPKPCPECGSREIIVDSTWCASWVQCGDCEYILQHECSETAVVKRWNKINRNQK